MSNAVIRLLLITLAVLTLTIFTVFAVRWMGIRQSYSPPPHAWFSKEFLWIHQPPLAELCRSAGYVSPGRDWIVVLPIKWIDSEWRINCPDPKRVEDFMVKTNHSDWLLEPLAAETYNLESFVPAFANYDKNHRFGVWAHTQKVAKFLRAKAPQWVFAADSTSLLRLRLFSSLFVETAIDFWPDFVLASDKKDDTYFLTTRSAQELRRRGKRVVWHWKGDKLTDSGNTQSFTLPYSIDGVMSDNIAAARTRFSQP